MVPSVTTRGFPHHAVPGAESASDRPSPSSQRETLSRTAAVRALTRGLLSNHTADHTAFIPGDEDAASWGQTEEATKNKKWEPSHGGGETNVGWQSKDNLKDLKAIIPSEWQEGHLAKGWSNPFFPQNRRWSRHDGPKKRCRTF